MAMSPAATLSSLTYYLTSGSTPVRPGSWTISLHSGNPGTAGTANEVTDPNYARQSGQFSIDNSDPAAPFAANSAAISYPAAQSSYSVSYIVVWDSTNNQPLVIQRLVTDKVIAAGEPAQFAVGTLKIGGRN